MKYRSTANFRDRLIFMNLHLLVACTSVMCLGWHYPILAKKLAVTADYKQSKELIAQTPQIPLGTLKPEQPEPSKLPDTLPSPSTTFPLLVPKKSPISPSPAVTAKIRVKKVEVNGSTVFSPEELAAAVNSFIGKELSHEQLLEIRTAINQLYINKGYKTSGAFLPPQDIYNGVIQFQVVEGELERIDIQGLTRLKPSYVRSRLRLAGSAPLNISQLDAGLQLLQNDPLFTQVQAELTAGTSPGRNVLIVKLKEAPPLNAALAIDNREVPSVGSVGGTAALGYNNLLGLGDRVQALVGITQGVNSYNLSYEIPVNARNGTLGFRYSRGRNRVIEQPFAPLDITGRAQTYAIDYRQPIILTPTEELAFGVSAQLRRSHTFLFDDEPFSFTQGPENGESKVSVLRFNSDWLNRRNPNIVLAARSTLSLGLGVFDATINNTGTDGRFVSWQGQFQWVRALNEQKDTVAIARIAAQLTPDSLLPLEQFSIGGIDTVRGYRTNQRVGDNGIAGTVELRLPIVRDPGGFGLLQVVPFIDAGTIWSNNIGEANSADGTLLSTGLGLRWQLNDSLSASLDWGIPLISTDRQGNSLQDNGISFSVQFALF